MSYEASELAERVSKCNKITNSIRIVEPHYVDFPTSNYTVLGILCKTLHFLHSFYSSVTEYSYSNAS